MGQSIVECELLTGTRSAEGIYGQRSRGPRSKAEHMAAPTNAAFVKKTLANSEPSTHGPKRWFAASQTYVRSRGDCVAKLAREQWIKRNRARIESERAVS
jgi:hypothetical protein